MTREFVDALATIPAKHRAWLEADDFALWCYYGWGVVLNSAQEDMARDVFHKWPPGTIHVLRWANRTGKTTGIDLVHLYAIWRKWRYRNEDFDAWLGYLYRTLHSAPLARLMGKAWQITDALIAGTADQQRSPLTNRQRPGLLRSFFHADKGTDPSGSDVLFVKCDNGAQIDFLSTHDGAARLESEAWWLISWDEFARQQPVSDVPKLIDETFLPRSSDYMAPLLFSSTATEDSEPIYGELEDMAEQNPRDWNFMSAKREVNFSQTKESIERQMRLSLDKEIAGRSVMGLSGQSGFGLFPDFVLKNSFVEWLGERTPPDKLPAGYKTVAAFDHALAGDENVLTILGMPWPPGKADLLAQPILGLAELILRSSRTLTLPEQLRFVSSESAPYHPNLIVVDATSEGGLHVYREGRKTMPFLDCAFTARLPGVRASNKEYALQALQRMFSWGLEAEVDDVGWVDSWPTPRGNYGALRLPSAWRRTRRQLTTYRRYDEKLTQDRVMTLAMLAWYLIRLYDVGQRQRAVPWNMMARRTRPSLVGGVG